MKPKKTLRRPLDGRIRMPLAPLLDSQHPLYRLAATLDWAAAEARFGALYAEVGRSGVPIRLRVGLQYLKQAFNESDESVVAQWVENP
jgi:transposase, IS5 family